MSNPEFHQQHPDDYDDGHLEALGALIGWLAGRGERPPFMTATFREGLAHMTACAFNAGYRTGRATASASDGANRRASR
jgi:hypothetical protein